MFNDSDNPSKLYNYRYILAFGSNLGDKKENCQKGLKQIMKINNLIKHSNYIETQPLESEQYSTTHHKNYCNMVCEILSKDKPLELYEKIIKIEDQVGHNRSSKWLPRELDIDILFWAKNNDKKFDLCLPLTLEEKDFFIPHKDFKNRGFLQDLCLKDLGLSKNCINQHLNQKLNE